MTCVIWDKISHTYVNKNSVKKTIIEKPEEMVDLTNFFRLYNLRKYNWKYRILFFHSHNKWRGIAFMWKMTFGICIKSLRSETPWVRKNGFYESVWVSVVGRILENIRYNYRTELNYIGYYIGAEKVRTNSLTSHIWPKL